MNETSKEYILQWSGHAASITERFSGLLAKQALVDVTLICQEQKLRVHKLVLASCSFYFEEMLEQDLGQEPIILLKDLDFDILKAMVEFMYCGETTIAHCHLKPLLEAAHVFKVKDLESIVKCMMSTKSYVDDTDKSSKSDKDLNDTVSPIRNCVQVKLSGRESTEKSLTESSDNKISKSDLEKQTPVELGHATLDNNEHEAEIFCDMIESTNELATRSNENQSKNILQRNVSNFKKFSPRNNRTNGDNQTQLANNKILNDLSTKTDKEHNEKTRSHKNNNLESNLDLSDLPSKVGECSKVYTCKKRKLTDCRKTLLSTPDLLTKSQPTDCIDLSDDLSCDTTPITLPSLALDMNATDKVWSLNTDNIHYIIGNTLNQTNALIRDRQRIIYEEIDGERSIIPNHKSIRQIKELFSVDNDNISMGRTPILRRSVRLNQLETDDSVNNNHSNNNNNNNNNNEETQKIKEKHNEFKSLSKSLTKSKRKKELSSNGIVPDENTVSKKSVNNPRSRNNKLTSKSAGSSRRLSKIKDEKSRSKFKKTVKMTKMESLDADGYSPVKLNTIATVERALWGDMSDVIENHENATMIPEYSMSKEIPFAVGLLPLHAALERMQAMPDYQPRKTRSSFAIPMKHDANCLKRKAAGAVGVAAISNNSTTTTTTPTTVTTTTTTATTTEDETISNKKQCSLEQIVDNTSSTFCHIKIQTSSQCSQSCDNSTTDHLVTIESNLDKR